MCVSSGAGGNGKAGESTVAMCPGDSPSTLTRTAPWAADEVRELPCTVSPFPEAMEVFPHPCPGFSPGLCDGHWSGRGWTKASPERALSSGLQREKNLVQYEKMGLRDSVSSPRYIREGRDTEMCVAGERGVCVWLFWCVCLCVG